MKYIASCSFGKDSLAMIIKIKEMGWPLDEVIYCDVRFDDNISGEMPEMKEFIPKAEKILKEKFGIEIKHLTYEKTFKEQFYTKKKKGKHIGDIYGFPHLISPWCNSKLKINPVSKYLKTIKEPIIQYIGIAYDEPERYKRLKSNQVAPLYILKITEKEALEICKKNNLLSPIYEKGARGGCWFCPNQRVSQLKKLYKEHNDLWNILKDMQKDSQNVFKPGYKLENLEKRFRDEIDKEYIKRIKKYIETDAVYQEYKKNKDKGFTDFECFCIEHCQDIEKVLKQLGEYK